MIIFMRKSNSILVKITLCQKKAISIVGEYGFKNSITTLKVNSRFPEYSMINDPEKVWPGAIVHYAMDASLGKFRMTIPSYMLA